MKEATESLNFIEHIIEEDLANDFPKEKLCFRFPPEPNGYLHIGHAASICLNFGLGEKYGAPVNLRFDDTNPAKEEQEYVDAIKRDIAWLGFKWAKECYSSDYFQQLYHWAVLLIQQGKSYVDQQTSEQIAEQKGTPTSPGTPSPFRDRSIAENLDLFERMKNGEFAPGTYLLRAKIDMASPNMHMRDPILYRIIRAHHHRTGDTWNIYPMYDWAHGESDYIEQVSHSICTLEFKAHRELYDWYLDQIIDPSLLRPTQREFARRNLSFTVMSKRKLLELVQKNVVSGWDDPRMPTISGLRRRGYTPSAIRNFSEVAGISKRDNVTDVSLLEFCVREDLNQCATRVMAVLNPIKVVIQNYPEGQVEILHLENNPEKENSGTHEVPFSRELYIEREDFKEEADKNFFRLSIGQEVRLKSAYLIKAESVVKDAAGNLLEIHCSYDADSKSGSGTEASQRKVKSTIHWVSVAHAIQAEVREYDRLFLDESPDTHESKSYMDFINPNSLKVIKNAFLEPYLGQASPNQSYQFQRLGYFTLDSDSREGKLVFNKTVGLKDTWAKQNAATANKQQTTAKPVVQAPQEVKSALNEIQYIGKKLTNLSGDKLEEALENIRTQAENISYEELEPLFATAAKKVGTRIAVLVALSVLLAKGSSKTPTASEFITSCLSDESDILREEAAKIA
ncbi:MAG: glutamine--tRNA ligase/YqeY domain fusion protein [Bacteroidetes bacterium]|nr:glutamine--tRNA ligase/YqeY domain fusion protein [Bacteroidota bacterium]